MGAKGSGDAGKLEPDRQGGRSFGHGVPGGRGEGLQDLLRRGIRVIRQEGWQVFWRKAKARLSTRTGAKPRRYPAAGWTEKIGPLTFPSVQEPRVSIVIPVFNKALYTYNCLKSILENGGDVPYEVIVVDDGSTDNTAEVLENVSNLTVLRESSNCGFVNACNRGARTARGEFIVFLNNDTQVRKGWLHSLLGTIEKDASVGLVGAKLLYPNGALQEAGGIVWNDASGWNYGRHDDAEKPEYNYVREVDYCSGACIIVPKELFQRVGGFDREYAPAYYEDTDLAFTVRALGYKVLYQPQAEIIHYEGITAGTDLSSGIKRFQEINRQKFLLKWQDVLTKDHWPSGSDLLAACHRGNGRNMLIVEHHVPAPDRDSGSQRMYFILRLLKELGFSVTLLPDDLARREPYTEHLQQMGVLVLYGRMRIREYISRLGPHLDLAIVARPELARAYVPLLRRFAPRARLVYDTVDLHFLREARRAEVDRSRSAGRAAHVYRRLELAVARACDAVITVSEEEKAILQEEGPGLQVYVIPNVHEVLPRRRPISLRKDLLFVGNFFHHPNEDAVFYFVREILPLVKNVIPQLKFYIVGSNPSRAVRALASEDVVVTGWVKEVSSFFENCRVFVAPLRYGSGMKGKVGQSLSYGLPVVTTSVGAEGMDLLDGVEALIADEPGEFARKTIALYQDERLWATLSGSGLRHVEKHWTPEIVKGRLGAMLSEILAPSQIGVPGPTGRC